MKDRMHTGHSINGLFVPLLLSTIDSPAWRAMSHGARSLYLALKRRYNATINNNGKIHLSQREAASILGSHTDYITRWFRELQHYGFIIMTAAGSVGVEGHGKAPHWRLTELEYKTEPPSREFARWSGEPFKNKKRNPVPQKRDALSLKGRTPTSRKSGTLVTNPVPQKRDISVGPVCGKGGTYLDSSSHFRQAQRPPLRRRWSKPHLKELFGRDAAGRCEATATAP